jgi:hypothetical protein
VAAAPAPAASGSSELLSVVDDKFSEWVAVAENAAKWETSLNQPATWEM